MPGSPGAWADTGASVSGADGVDGRNSYTETTATTTIPVAGGFMLITVPDSTDPLTAPDGGISWMVPGNIVFVETAGFFQYLNPVGANQAALLNLRNDATGEYLSNAVSGTLAIGSAVVPGGLQGPAGLPVEFSSGAPDPTTAPAGGASGAYIQSGTGGTYWYYNGTTAGPWTDTGIGVTGPAGPTGASGANGHTPVLTMTTLAPSGGVVGDWHIQQVNGGKWQVYYNNGGWVGFAAGTILGNRLIGTSTTTDPNTAGITTGLNVNDYYQTLITGQYTFWTWNGTIWVASFTFATSGGSSAPVDAEYVVAVANATLSNERVANATATVVPDTTVPGQMRWNIPDDGVTNAKLNNVPSNTFKGLGLGGPANPIDLTANQASTILDTATDPFVRTSAIPGGTVSLQSATNGSPVLGDGRGTGDKVWTMERGIQYQPSVQPSAGTGTTFVFQTDEYEHLELTLTHDTVTLSYDPPTYDTANFMLAIDNTTAAELSFLYSASAWKANEGVTPPYTVPANTKIVLVAHYVDGFMWITNVLQNPTTL